jgi:acyl-CoA thioesterase-2
MSNHFEELLPMEEVGDGGFVVRPGGHQPFLYAGVTMAAMMRTAAASAPPGTVPMSLKVSFLAGGVWGDPLAADVHPFFDSRAFSGRRVVLEQGDRAVSAGDVWFHRPEEGTDAQHAPLPAAPPPDELARQPVGFPLDLVDVRPWGPRGAHLERLHPYWARPYEPISDPVLRACALLFVSDYGVIFTPFPAGSGSAAGLTSRTLEHSLWFHRPIPEDGWWHFDATPLTVGGGRYVSRGTIHHEHGQLLASFVQEGFIRLER